MSMTTPSGGVHSVNTSAVMDDANDISAPPLHVFAAGHPIPSGLPGGGRAPGHAMEDIDRAEWMARVEATAATAQNDARNALLQVEQVKRQVLAAATAAAPGATSHHTEVKSDTVNATFWLGDVANMCRENATAAAAALHAVANTEQQGAPRVGGRGEAGSRSGAAGRVGNSVLELFDELSTDVADSL